MQNYCKKAYQRIFDTCNLIGEDCDITAVMYRYKAVRELPENEFDEMYDKLATQLGF